MHGNLSHTLFLMVVNIYYNYLDVTFTLRIIPGARRHLFSDTLVKMFLTEMVAGSKMSVTVLACILKLNDSLCPDKFPVK